MKQIFGLGLAEFVHGFFLVFGSKKIFKERSGRRPGEC